MALTAAARAGSIVTVARMAAPEIRGRGPRTQATVYPKGEARTDDDHMGGKWMPLLAHIRQLAVVPAASRPGAPASSERDRCGAPGAPAAGGQLDD